MSFPVKDPMLTDLKNCRVSMFELCKQEIEVAEFVDYVISGFGRLLADSLGNLTEIAINQN
jgi:hypothetical protein